MSDVIDWSTETAEMTPDAEITMVKDVPGKPREDVTVSCYAAARLIVALYRDVPAGPGGPRGNVTREWSVPRGVAPLLTLARRLGELENQGWKVLA